MLYSIGVAFLEVKFAEIRPSETLFHFNVFISQFRENNMFSIEADLIYM